MSEDDPLDILPLDSALLSVSFDSGQVGSKLLWSVTEGRKNLLQPYGEYAGSLYFDVSSLTSYCVPVVLTAYGSSTFRGFTVEDATIVSIPRNYVPTTTPSPFKACFGYFATTPVGPFAYGKVVCDRTSGRKLMRAISKNPLTVAPTPGAWQLSMLLTVSIHFSDKSCDKTRVFTFDPEAQVGNGSIHHLEPPCSTSDFS